MNLSLHRNIIFYGEQFRLSSASFLAARVKKQEARQIKESVLLLASYSAAVLVLIRMRLHQSLKLLIINL